MTNDLIPYQPAQTAIPQETPDERFIELWLHGRPLTTQRVYRAAIRDFLAFANKPIQQITLLDLQDYANSLPVGMKNSTRASKLKAVKSMLTFAQKTGFTRFNAGAALRLPKTPRQLAARILPKDQVLKMIYLEPSPRNQALLRLLYGGGLRVSEACGLYWRDLQPRADGRGQVNVIGKGEEPRSVLVSMATWQALQGLRRAAGEDEPVFRSRGGGRGKAGAPLDTSQAWRIVRRAARRAGIEKDVSPHWMRHAHISHALDEGAPPHVVRDTVGHSGLEIMDQYAHAKPETSSSQYLTV